MAEAQVLQGAGYPQNGLADNYSINGMRRHYPKERDGTKNEWKAVVTHLGEVSDTMRRAERDVKSYKSAELQQFYEDRLREGDMHRRREAEQRLREQEEANLKRKLEEYELERLRVGKGVLQDHLATNYKAMMDQKYYNDREKKDIDQIEALKMIELAKKSLEIEKMTAKEKGEYFKKEAKTSEEYAEMRRQLEKDRSLIDKGIYNEQLLKNIEKDMLRDTNYRNYFKHTLENQTHLQELHAHNVLVPAQEKQHRMEEVIQRGEQEARRRLEEIERQRLQKKQDDTSFVASKVREQILNHQELMGRQKEEAMKDVEERFRTSAEYHEFLKNQKHEAKDQQKWYKDLLDRQLGEKWEKYGRTNAMNKKEKAINVEPLKAYKEADSHVTVLLPGYENSRYIHPYSPDARYAHLLSHKDFAPNTAAGSMSAGLKTQTGMTHPKDRTDRESTNIFQQEKPQQNLQSILGAPPQLNYGTSPTSLNYSNSNGNLANNGNMNVNRSVPSLGTGAGVTISHNPITNPIPNVLQNPYLLKEFRKIGAAGGNQSFLASVASNNIILK